VLHLVTMEPAQLTQPNGTGVGSGIPMWNLRFENVPNGPGMLGKLERAGAPASFAEVIGALRDDAALRAALSSGLAALPYRAFKWETPPVTRATLRRAFECVVLDSPRLARSVDAITFAEHFVETEAVVTFPSLGRDAILVAPCPRGALSSYGHLAAFVRNAPRSQQHALWTRVGDAMDRRVGDQPVWLSTAGGGVAWLHVRLDDHPKYYGYAPYRVYPRLAPGISECSETSSAHPTGNDPRGTSER
jgi:hypothetical protein